MPLFDARRRRQATPDSTCATARPLARFPGQRTSRACATTGRCASHLARATPTPATTPRPTRSAGWWCSATTSPPATAPGSSTPRRRSARTTTRPARRYGLPLLLRRRRRARSSPAPASSLRRHVVQGRRPRDHSRLSARGLLLHASATATTTPSAGAATGRCSTTPPRAGSCAPRCRRIAWSRTTARSTGTRRTSARAASATGWRTWSTGRCRASATGARRCRSGSATRAAHQRGDRLATPSCSSAAGKPLPANVYDRAQFDPAPALHRRDHLALREVRQVRRHHAPRRGGHRRLVRLRRDAVRPAPLPVREPRRARPAGAASPPTSSPRRSTRRAAGSTPCTSSAILLFDTVAFENCIVLGHVNDEQGRKMSKRLGNVVEPMAVIEETGRRRPALVLLRQQPGAAVALLGALVREAAQGFLLPLWNALSFFTIYANLDGWQPGPARSRRSPSARRSTAGSCCASTTWCATTTAAPRRATASPTRRARIEEFVDDLTNWYIRRSRDRFWARDERAAGSARTRRAPTRPSTRCWPRSRACSRRSRRSSPRCSTSTWCAASDAGARRASTSRAGPSAGRAAARSRRWRRAWALVQRIVRLGHAARNTHGLKTRQPLAARHPGGRATAASPAMVDALRSTWCATSSTSRDPLGRATAPSSSTTRCGRTSPCSASASASACRRSRRRSTRPTATPWRPSSKRRHGRPRARRRARRRSRPTRSRCG